MILILILALFIVLGTAGMTFLPGILAAFFWRSRTQISPIASDDSLDILIPVRNQASELQSTLHSFQKSFPHALIFVGVNDSQDDSEKVARAAQARIVARAETGKWGMLVDLVAQSQAPWVALIDAGTVLPDGHFAERLHLSGTPADLLGLAPRYRPTAAGRIRRLYWWFEACLKKMENRAGGPISVHGAACFYRGPELRALFAEQKNAAWLNDDILIPLLLRHQNPGRRIFYRFDLCVNDVGQIKDATSKNRRRRMVRGNLQWMGYLWNHRKSFDMTLLILAMRRVFRLLWAWWLLLAGLVWALALGHFSETLLAIFVLTLMFSLVVLRRSEGLAGFWASLFLFRDRGHWWPQPEIETGPWR